jgi:hypothetical protein
VDAREKRPVARLAVMQGRGTGGADGRALLVSQQTKMKRGEGDAGPQAALMGPASCDGPQARMRGREKADGLLGLRAKKRWVGRGEGWLAERKGNGGRGLKLFFKTFSTFQTFKFKLFSKFKHFKPFS